jgi:hypothetical protein
MVWFYARGQERRFCETRLADDDKGGYDLIVTDESGSHIERFLELSRLLSREHELLAAWRAQGWRVSSTEKGSARAPIAAARRDQDGRFTSD